MSPCIQPFVATMCTVLVHCHIMLPIYFIQVRGKWFYFVKGQKQENKYVIVQSKLQRARILHSCLYSTAHVRVTK